MRIGTTLRAATRGLAAPPGARLRILEELRADLEDLQASLRAAGVPEAEARRRAEALLAPDAAALEALSRVHRPLWVRWRERAPVRGGRGVGVALGLLVLAGVGAVLREAASLGDLPLFLVPLGGIGLAAGVHALGKAVRIWVAGESAAARVRAGSGDLLVAAAGATVATAIGVLFELHRTAGLVIATPAQETALVLAWLRRSVILGAAGIAVVLPCGLAWLFYVHQAAGLERRERALLGPDLEVGSGAPDPFPSARGDCAPTTTRRPR